MMSIRRPRLLSLARMLARGNVNNVIVYSEEMCNTLRVQQPMLNSVAGVSQISQASNWGVVPVDH
jgi:hypothetical protein